jgi:hypothetical protein
MLKTVGFPSTRTGNQTIVNGNLVIGTAGNGIDFSATSGTGTSELLADYEEGTWTPTFTGWSVAPTSVVAATYTKVGRQVTVNCTVNGGTCILGNRIGGLPFTVGNTCSSATLRDFSGGTAVSVGVPKNTATEIWNLSAATFTGLFWGMSATYFV